MTMYFVAFGWKMMASQVTSISTDIDKHYKALHIDINPYSAEFLKIY